jgi:hypothetical protein
MGSQMKKEKAPDFSEASLMYLKCLDYCRSTQAELFQSYPWALPAATEVPLAVKKATDPLFTRYALLTITGLEGEGRLIV